jgi:hypothetical protein
MEGLADGGGDKDQKFEEVVVFRLLAWLYVRPEVKISEWKLAMGGRPRDSAILLSCEEFSPLGLNIEETTWCRA